MPTTSGIRVPNRVQTPDADRRRRLLVLAICCMSMVVVVMDLSIVNVALPDMRRELDASPSGLQWTVDAYALVLAVLLVVSGSLADRFGRRRMFLVGLAIFGIGSLACGLATSQALLIVARALQGLGGAVVDAVSLALIVRLFRVPEARARAIGSAITRHEIPLSRTSWLSEECSSSPNLTSLLRNLERPCTVYGTSYAPHRELLQLPSANCLSAGS